MKNPFVKEIGKYLFKAYIIWSVCADLVLIAGVLALLFVDFKIIF
jgi:hypothetical protein|tara:strand:- start:437 stop:571 length:135 start_codon:yes stop_codon:yes gene_type:complete